MNPRSQICAAVWVKIGVINITDLSHANLLKIAFAKGSPGGFSG